MFKNRKEAGVLLAKKLDKEGLIHPEAVVLGISRGGLVLADEVASYFNLPLDVIIVKKLSAPLDAELAIGAVGETKGSKFLEKSMIRDLQISDSYLQTELNSKVSEIKDREKKYRRGKKQLPLSGKEVIIVDDGSATGATMISAAREVWNNQPSRLILAIPVVPLDTLLKLEKEADSVIALETPSVFFSVSQFYEKFPQLTDTEVEYLLKNRRLLNDPARRQG